MKTRPSLKRAVSYCAVLFNRANGWFPGGYFPANILANALSSFFRVVLSLFLTIASLSPRFIDVWPITAAAMALVPPNVDVSNGNSISFARWATRNSQHRFLMSSASNSTCMTTIMRMRNHVAPRAVRTTLDLHIYIHAHLRLGPSTVVLQVLSDPRVVENERFFASSVILNRCLSRCRRGRLCYCTNHGFESLRQ